MYDTIDLVALRQKAEKMVESKSDKENMIIRFHNGGKAEIIGGPNMFTITDIPKALTIDLIEQLLFRQETERWDYEARQWRGG